MSTREEPTATTMAAIVAAQSSEWGPLPVHVRVVNVRAYHYGREGVVRWTDEYSAYVMFDGDRDILSGFAPHDLVIINASSQEGRAV